ncbi:MAG: hypothetical protein ACI4EH_05420 [Oliverpabstia sp.]
MYSLLKMILYRCRCSKLFWLALIASFAAGVVFGFSTSDFSFGQKGTFDDMFIVPLFVIECGFLSLMIGREYSDGTIRNKVISGKKRGEIYIANVCMAFIVTTIFVTMFVVGFLLISYGTTLIYLPYGVRIRTLIAFVFKRKDIK